MTCINETRNAKHQIAQQKKIDKNNPCCLSTRQRARPNKVNIKLCLACIFPLSALFIILTFSMSCQGVETRLAIALAISALAGPPPLPSALRGSQTLKSETAMIAYYFIKHGLSRSLNCSLGRDILGRHSLGRVWCNYKENSYCSALGSHGMGVLRGCSCKLDVLVHSFTRE